MICAGNNGKVGGAFQLEMTFPCLFVRRGATGSSSGSGAAATAAGVDESLGLILLGLAVVVAAVRASCSFSLSVFLTTPAAASLI